MKLIRADHDRRIEIPGVPEPVQRPVDIDRLQTGFVNLRSLRIYHFTADSIIDGHAEEDEVVIVLLAGSIELTLIEIERAEVFHLTAAADSPGEPCAAYLPPNAAYRLVPHTAADVAYARATPVSGAAPGVFRSVRAPDGAAMVLLSEQIYPRLLRVRLVQVKATQAEVALDPLSGFDAMDEALIHVRTAERAATIALPGAAPVPIDSWDTVAITSAERPLLSVAAGSSALVLIVVTA